ncbi:glycosyltransferase family 4 protein [bacterium]|nr:glycosyltransferase family 4 protein [bacterium]MBU4511042.1 glycosyltransferase family 4 protein [bacterium]
MRIAIDARMGDTSGGIGVYIRALISHLVEIDRNNQYFIIVYKHGDRSFVPSADNFSILESSISHKHYFIKDLWNQIFLPFLLEANSIDLYFNPRYILPFFKGKTKMVVTIHDMIAFLYPEIWRGISGFRIRNYIKLSSQRADTIITDSICAKKDIVQILNIPDDKIKVMYCGVNNNLFKPISDLFLQKSVKRKYGIQKDFILAIGPLNLRKNHGRLIDAYGKLPKYIITDYQLVIIGEKRGTYNNLLKKVSKNCVVDDIVFTGFISEKEMPMVISAASLFVFPSLYEGFGIPPLEAMACGTPVVASNISSIPEVVGDAALLFDPYNINEMASAIYRAITDKNLRQELVQKGFERVKKYSWENTAKEILGVFEEVCNGAKK